MNDLPSLLASLERALAEAPAETLPPLVAQLAALQTALAARLLATWGNGTGPVESQAEPDQLLTAEEAARRLGVSRDTLYRRRWPFETRPTPGTRRFSNKGIDRYIRQRQGR